MVRNARRRMQNAVNVVRGLEAGLSERRPSDLLILSNAAPLIFASEDLCKDLVVGDSREAESIATNIQNVIADQARRGIHGDPSGLNQISDPVSRLICQRQIPIANRIHLMAAILVGVEAGLRGVIMEYPAPTKAAARGSVKPDVKRVRTPDTIPVVSSLPPPANLRSSEQSWEESEQPPTLSTSGTTRVTPDTPDL